MTSYLRVDLIKPDGNVELGRLATGELLIGRDPGVGITIDNTAVSRQHGVFTRARNHWFYKDLGSTNGSWLNGVPVAEGRWKLIRGGDILQAADTALGLFEVRETGMVQSTATLPVGSRSLVVFQHGKFLDEYPVPEYGRALVVGGPRSDLALEGDMDELPSLVVERRGDKICAFRIAKTTLVFVNGSEITELVNLRDSDEIRVGEYEIIFNDPVALRGRGSSLRPSAQFGSPSVETSIIGTEGKGTRPVVVQEWGGTDARARSDAPREMFTAKPSTRLPFGQTEKIEAGVEETLSIEPGSVEEGLSSGERHPATRYATPERGGGESSLEQIEDKVILILGFILLLALLVLVVWWVLT